MKFKEYCEKNNGGIKDIGKFLLKGIITIGKAIKTILIYSWKFIAWILDEFIKFLVLAEQMLLLKVTNGDKEKKLDCLYKINAGILISMLLIGGGFFYMNHINNSLENQLATINNTQSKDKSKEKTEKKINEAKSADISGEVYITSRGLSSDYYGNGYVRYKEGDEVVVEVCKTYGIGEFTDSVKSGARYVKNVTDYVKKVDPDFYEKYFSKVHAPGTTTFTTGWQDAAQDEKFKEYQLEYLYINYVEPTMKELVDKYKIDKDNKAIKELVFATSVQYGYKGTLTFFEKAKITKDMTNNEVIKYIQQEKRSALGIYTFTDTFKYNIKDRQKVTKEIESETEKLLNM